MAAFTKRKEMEAARKTHKRMSIVAGKHARRRLLSPSGLDTRPMMAMVRGDVLDMMLNFLGSRSSVRFPNSRWLVILRHGRHRHRIHVPRRRRGALRGDGPLGREQRDKKNLNALGLDKETTTTPPACKPSWPNTTKTPAASAAPSISSPSVPRTRRYRTQSSS